MDGWQGRIGNGDGLMKVFWCEELDHAQIFEAGCVWMGRLVEEICEVSKCGGRKGTRLENGVDSFAQSVPDGYFHDE